MNTEISLISVIVQGGGIGLSAMLIWVVWRLVSNHDAHLLDALNRNSEAWVKNMEALTRLTEKLENLAK